MRKDKPDIAIMAMWRQISNIRGPDYNWSGNTYDYINSIKIWDKQVKIRGKPMLSVV